MERVIRFGSLRFSVSAVPRARPGAAQPPPIRPITRVPVVGRLLSKRHERQHASRQAAVPSRLSLRRLLGLRGRRSVPPVKAPRFAILSRVANGMRWQLESTARVVQAAREVRTPMTRWERMRETARLAMEDPVSVTRWERWVGLGVALAAGSPSPPSPKRGMVARLLGGAGQSPDGADAHARPGRRKKNADPGSSRGRHGSKPRR